MSKTLNLNLVLVVVILCAIIQRHRLTASDARVVGGSKTSIANVPYLVNLRKNGEFFCGGTLITSRYVVTAAHCVKGLSSSNLTVVGGATNLTEKGVRRNVDKIYIPKSYRSSTLNNDVAVLKLSDSLTGDNISTVNLCTSSWNVGEYIQVSGWGLTSEKAANVSNLLRTVKVPLMSRTKCASQYKYQATLTKSMFCASVPGLRDPCSGDSGGPAIYKGQLCGIVSWGIGCARNGKPGVYTYIKVVKSFIENAMNM